MVEIVDKGKIKRYLLLGLLGCLLAIFGEFAMGFVDTGSSQVDWQNPLDFYVVWADLPLWRMGIGLNVGALGILLQFFGYYAIYLSFKVQDTWAAKAYRIGLINYSVGGAISHIFLATALYILGLSKEGAIQYGLYVLSPFLVVFTLIHLVFCLILFYQFFREQTLFPKAFGFLNPLLGSLLFHLLSFFIPHPALANGISFAHLSLVSIIFLGSLFIYLRKT